MLNPDILDSGQKISTLTNIELTVLAQRAWDACQGDDLRKLRAEAKRRGIQVV